MARAAVAPDGTPEHVSWVEGWLVGGAMLAPAAAIPVALVPADFHDDTLGLVWDAITAVVRSGSDPTLPLVASVLAERRELDTIGAEPRLASLCTSEGAFIYSPAVCLAAHASLVHRWGLRRQGIAHLADQAKAIHDGRVIRFTGGVTYDYIEAAQ